MVESMLRSAGYSTGLFTSPHLCDVRERVRINGYAAAAACCFCFDACISSTAQPVVPAERLWRKPHTHSVVEWQNVLQRRSKQEQ
jgi:hypothetical protein